jgi:hypothetical protein
MQHCNAYKCVNVSKEYSQQYKLHKQRTNFISPGHTRKLEKFSASCFYNTHVKVRQSKNVFVYKEIYLKLYNWTN